MQQYDMMLSLGGSCAEAHQLRVRGLRRCSLPFDWLYCTSAETLYRLVDCFDNDFAHWLEAENLVEMPVTGRNSGAAHQYHDTLTGYRFIHDFKRPKEACLDEVRRKYQRRIDRMYKMLRRAQSVALCFDASYSGCEEGLMAVREKLMEKFLGLRTVDIYHLALGAAKCEERHEGPLNVYSFTHKTDDYIYSIHPTFEFRYMDDIALTNRVTSGFFCLSNWIYLTRIPHGLMFWFFRQVRPILDIALTVFGCKCELRIGQ